jgi:type II secretory pathway component GspD/PulD (secretin)
MDENGLPFLKDIPFLGYLFKSENKTTSKTDLMFFIRPTIINANGPRNEEHGVGIERDLTPAVYELADGEKAGMRPGSYRKLERMAKPAHYNESGRPKTAADVKPGA